MRILDGMVSVGQCNPVFNNTRRADLSFVVATKPYLIVNFLSDVEYRTEIAHCLNPTKYSR